MILPTGYRESGEGKAPLTTVLTGKLNEDEKLLAIAQKFQAKFTAHNEHPDLDPWVKKFEAGTLDEDEKDESKKEGTDE